MQNFAYKILVFLFLSVPTFAAAQTQKTVEVTGVVNPEFSRIIFHTTISDAFQVVLNAGQLHITLPNPIQANFRSMLKTLNAQVTSASLEQGGRKVVIRLKNTDVRLRKLRGPDFFGVDLVPQKKVETKEADSAPQKIITLPEPKKPEPKKPEVKKPEPKAKTKPVETKKPAVKSPEEKAKKPAPQTEVSTLAKIPAEVVRVMPGQATKLFTVPWDKMVSAAIYIRGDRLWMVFDRFTQVPLTNFSRQQITAIQQIADRQNTILKLTLSPEATKNPDWIWANREQNDWVLYYGNPPAEKPITMTTPEETGENEIKLTVRHTAEPLNMLDPEIGDSLFVVPVRDPGNRVMPGRRFVETEAFPTIQGIVLLRRSDAAIFKVLRDGVSISSKKKLFTSSAVKQTRVMATPKGELEKKTMYPFAHQTDPAKFMPIYYQYLKDLQAEPEATRSPLRLKMAEHLFLSEYYAEALGLLRDILIDDPEFSATAGIKPMIAGSLFMMERYDQAEDAFATILASKEMPEYAEEQKLWRWASIRMIEQQNLVALKPEEGFDIVPALNTYLSSYPYPLRRKLLLIYTEQLLNDSRTGAARKLFKEIRFLGATESESELLDFFEARAQLIDGKKDDGLARLKAVADGAKSPRVRTLALLEGTRIAKESAIITLPEAINALEKGRIEWRGDIVEFTLLKQLGQYYIDNKQYVEGLRVWRELVTQFSGTTESLKVASDMAKVFASLFDTGGGAYQLPPLQALSTFFEFNELTPVGVQGDHISRMLADYLASVDLLENAAAILTHQVRFRSQGEDRAQLALKLIDLHLVNNRPDLAREVMDAMSAEKIPAALQSQYSLLGAETLVQQGKYPEALKLLEKEESQTARDLKLAVFWHQQEWERVIGVMEPELKARAKKIEVLSANEEERVLRLAIAYSKLRRFDDLKWLKEAFGKRIKNPQLGDAFDFVSDSNTPIDHTALESSLEMDKIRSFLSKYRLPEPPPPPAPPAPAAEEKKPEGEPADKKAEEKSEEKKADEKKPEEKKE